MELSVSVHPHCVICTGPAGVRGGLRDCFVTCSFAGSRQGACVVPALPPPRLIHPAPRAQRRSVDHTVVADVEIELAVRLGGILQCIEVLVEEPRAVAVSTEPEIIPSALVGEAAVGQEL